MDGAFDAFLAKAPTADLNFADSDLGGSGEKHTPPTVYITFPCAKESGWDERHPGISNAIVFCDCPYAWFEQYKDEKVHHRSPEYERTKEALAEALFKVLWEKRPDLKDKVVWHEVGTPVTSEFYLGAFRGADYGTRVDTNYFSESGLRWLMRADTPVPGLFQSGQDAMTPSISGAMHGGLLCAWRMMVEQKKYLALSSSVLGVMGYQLRACQETTQIGFLHALVRVVRIWLGKAYSCK